LGLGLGLEEQLPSGLAVPALSVLLKEGVEDEEEKEEVKDEEEDATLEDENLEGQGDDTDEVKEDGEGGTKDVDGEEEAAVPLDGDATDEQEDSEEPDLTMKEDNEEEELEEEEDADEDEDGPKEESEEEKEGEDGTVEEEEIKEDDIDSSSSTEGQEAEINESTTKKNWEGVDEDSTSPKIDMSKQNKEEEEINHAHDDSHNVSELKDVHDYEGDGFRFHILHPKKGKATIMQSHPFGTAGVALLAAFFLCCCCLRWRKRRNTGSIPHRGKYAALGSDDFNGTFSDDISFHDKNSDDEMSMNSYESDEEGGGVKLEMGGMHEMDANGGLTLDECNG